MPRRPHLFRRVDRSRLRPSIPAVLVLVLGSCALLMGPGCSSTSVTGDDGPSLTPGTVDLQIIGSRTASTLVFEDRNFDPGDCAVLEGWVGGSGIRRILRFDSLIANMGALELKLGDPSNPQPPFTSSDFEFSACYGTYLFEDYAEFELQDSGGLTVGTGHKLACCVLDSLQLASSFPRQYNDCGFQGLTPGWADLYPSDLDGQWVDVTGVPQGDYYLTVRANPTGRIPETTNTYSNEATILVHVPDPTLPPP